MGPAFLGGIAQAFPQASVTLDRYHLVALLTRAVDVTRKAETKKATKFKRTRWLWLKNPTNLSEKEKLSLQELLEENAFPLTGKAYGLRLAFQELFKVPRCQAQTAFYEWIGMALASEIHAVVEVAVTFFNAADKILRWFETRISNGFLEGLLAGCRWGSRASPGFQRWEPGANTVGFVKQSGCGIGRRPSADQRSHSLWTSQRPVSTSRRRPSTVSNHFSLASGER